MKSRALTIISLSFAILLFGRAYEVSSEIAEADAPAPELHNKQDVDGNAPEIPGSKATVSTDHNNKEQCLTGDIHDILIADTERIERRASELSEREAALQKLETTLEAQLAGIEAASAQLDQQIAALKSGASEDLIHLVGMYETMKPKQAAKIFDAMDPAFAAGFLREMDSNAAGLIMANMDARKSYTISVIMASKNAKYR